MKFLIHPEQTEDPGLISIFPDNQKHAILAWTDVMARKYDFGMMYHQLYAYRHYRIYAYKLIAQQAVTLHRVFEQRTIALQFILKGTMNMLDAHKWYMYYAPEGFNTVSFDAGETTFVQIEFEPSYLDELAEGNEEVSLLMRSFDERDNVAKMLPVSYIDQRANEALAGIMQARETPRELPMELKTHIVMLLNLYRKSIKESEELGALPDVPYKELLVDIARQIKAAPALKYNIHTLARKHGIYYKTLARSFKDLTGYTLKLYVHEQRMHHALRMVTKTQLPFHEIAVELGYIEPNNLHRAFVKRFGRTLLEARKNPGMVELL